MNRALLALVLTGLSAVNAWGQAGPAVANPTLTVDRATLEKMIQAEVARQLPDAVSKEIARLTENARSEPNMHAKGASAQSTLQTFRGQLELYKIQHEDGFPSQEAMENWNALTQKTDSKGRFEAQGQVGSIYGPYLQRPVANPFTGKSALAPAGKATADSGWSYNARTGEFLIVLTDEDAKAGGVAPRDFEKPK